MRDDHATVACPLKRLDDSLTIENSTRTIEGGLTQSPVPPAPRCANESLRCVTNKS